MLSRAATFTATQQYIEHCKARGSLLGVMMLRVQRFREFTMHLGYEAAEQLAAAVQRTAQTALRPVDEIIQVGAAEFAVLLPGLHNPDHATLAASRLIRQFREPIELGDRPVLIEVIVGLALYPEHGDSPDRLFRCAERAYSNAIRSVDRYAVFSQKDWQVDISHDDLHEAIVNNRLELHLQPLWDLRRKKVAGVESLARWNNPRHGPIEPSVFIPMAEETGLITPLTRWSLNNSMHFCAQARKAGLDLPFAINLSPRVFPERGIVEQILAALRIWDIPPELIILEITETAVMDDPAMSSALLKRLRDQGLRIAIDDFGIGHSTFAYLQNTPATELKIDKSFVANMHLDQSSRQLVRSIIDLAKNLGLDVVAEGVERPETLVELEQMGCDYAQGYLIGRPQPAAQFIASQLERGTTDGVPVIQNG